MKLINDDKKKNRKGTVIITQYRVRMKRLRIIFLIVYPVYSSLVDTILIRKVWMEESILCGDSLVVVVPK